MRRLAIVLGVVGAFAGGIYAYRDARDVWNARSAHKRFESLVTTPAVQKDLKELVDTIQKGHSENLSAFSDGQLQVYKNLLENTPPGERQKLAGTLSEDRRKQLDAIVSQMQSRNESDENIQAVVDDFKKKYGIFINLDRKASGDGIDQFTVELSTSTITSIQLSTGELLSRTPPPTLMAWIALPLYPLVGFLIPWGAIRVLIWVGAGFFQSKPA